MEQILNRIGFKEKEAPAAAPREQVKRGEYPETAAYFMQFGDLLRAAKYGDDVLEQYKAVLHLEVRC